MSDTALHDRVLDAEAAIGVAFVLRARTAASRRCTVRSANIAYGPATRDPKLAAVVAERSIADLSDLNAEGMVDRLVARHYFCPSCALLFAVNVQQHGDPVMVEWRLFVAGSGKGRWWGPTETFHRLWRPRMTTAMAGYTIAVDIGGTFTDCVIHDAAGEKIVAAKAPSGARQSRRRGARLGDGCRRPSRRARQRGARHRGAVHPRVDCGDERDDRARRRTDRIPGRPSVTRTRSRSARSSRSAPVFGAGDLAHEPADDGRPAPGRPRARLRCPRASRLSRPRADRADGRGDRGGRGARPGVRGARGCGLPAVELPLAPSTSAAWPRHFAATFPTCTCRPRSTSLPCSANTSAG